MKARTAWLEETEKSRIADEAIELLSTAGMRFTGSQGLTLLAERGAAVDEATGIVRLPRDLVEWAIGRTPRSFVMAGADPAHDVVLGEEEAFHFCPSGCVAKTLDFRTGLRRPSSLTDLRECTALMDELSGIDLMWTQVSATDVPLERRELAEYFTVVTETAKHVTFVDCPHEVDAVVRMCEVLSGDMQRFRERPRISTVCTAASPLQVDARALDTHAALAKHGVPVEVYSMAIAGATSPVTLAGTVVQGLAEFLGIATALQVAAPGARLVFCFGSGILDMLEATFSLGCVESALMGCMATEVGHYLGVPTLNPGLSTDGKDAGQQTGYEKALKALSVCAANPDIVTGWGLLDSHNTMYLPQAVIDNEIAGMVRRLLGVLDVSDAALATGDIVDVGPGGSFLGVKDTARRIRAGEHYRPTVSRRLSYEKWAQEGLTEEDRAIAVAERALRTHWDKGPRLTEAQIDELASLCGVSRSDARHAHRS